MSATLHAWAAAGRPPPPYDAAPAAGHCATCGAETTAGVSLDQIETPTTSGHADLFRFGSQHVCPGCSWLFAAGKGRPGNYIAYGQRLEYTVISLESVVDHARPAQSSPLSPARAMPPAGMAGGLPGNKAIPSFSGYGKKSGESSSTYSAKCLSALRMPSLTLPFPRRLAMAMLSASR